MPDRRFRLRADVTRRGDDTRTLHFARQWMTVTVSFDTREEAEGWLGKLRESSEIMNEEICDLHEEASNGG